MSSSAPEVSNPFATAGTVVPGFQSDVTANALDALRVQDQFKLMAEWLPQLVWTTRADGTPDWYNQRWYEFTGMAAAADGHALDKTPFDWTAFVHQDDRPRIAEAWRLAVEQLAPYEVEYRLFEARSKDYRWVLARGQALRDESGNVVRWFGTCTDIDDQVREAERTRQLERAATKMLAAKTIEEVIRIAIDESMSALNADGTAINLYDERTRTLNVAGASDNELGKASLAWGPIPIDAGLLSATAARTRQTQYLLTEEDLSRTSSRAAEALRSLGVKVAAFCPMSVGDKLIGTLGFSFCRNVPMRREVIRFMEQLATQAAVAIDRARLYEEARDARAEAERASKAKSDFLAVMSHELRSPLNAIDGHSALIEDGIHGPVSDAQVSAIRRVRRSSRILLALINDLLDFSRLEAGKLTYSISTVSVQSLLDELNELVAQQVADRGLLLSIPPVGDKLSVTADPARARQILVNLVTNAMKFSNEKGRIDINVAVAGPEVRISVRDEGIGIASDQLETIFDPFMQVDKSHKRQQQGVGLGLSISRDLATGMGGGLTVESRLGHGSTFTLALPRG